MAAHDHAIGLAREVDVVGETALSGHQHRVFAARHRLADRISVQIEQCRVDDIIHASLLLAPANLTFTAEAAKAALPARGVSWATLEHAEPELCWRNVLTLVSQEGHNASGAGLEAT